MFWLRQETHDTTEQVLFDLNNYNQQEFYDHGIELDEEGGFGFFLLSSAKNGRIKYNYGT